MTIMRKPRKKTSVESIALTTLKSGESFYTHKHDKDITAIASYYEKKVKTERLLLLNTQTETVEKIVKVTIL
jgi:hypothetical protein